MHNPLEQYLEQVETRLRDLPAEERQSEVEEMRQHLQDSVSAHIELGCSHEEAIAQTLEQFGLAQTVGAELATAHDRKLRTRWDNVPMAAVMYITFGWLFHTANAMFSRHIYTMSLPISGRLYYLAPVAVASGMPLVLLIAFASGWLTAHVAPRHAIAGVVLGHVITLPLSLYGFMMLLPQIPAAQHDYVTHSVYMSWLRNFLVYMPVGMLGARLGRLWKRNLRRRLELAR